MSLDKAISHGKEHRKRYYGSKTFDSSCRPGGSCPYCISNRTHRNAKASKHASTDEQTDEYIDMVIGAGDPSDAMMDFTESIYHKVGSDRMDFECEVEELWYSSTKA